MSEKERSDGRDPKYRAHTRIGARIVHIQVSWIYKRQQYTVIQSCEYTIVNCISTVCASLMCTDIQASTSSCTLKCRISIIRIQALLCFGNAVHSIIRIQALLYLGLQCSAWREALRFGAAMRCMERQTTTSITFAKPRTPRFKRDRDNDRDARKGRSEEGEEVEMRGD